VQEAALRNGFRRIGGVDTFNISRVDVVRGPNALLYGVGNFGGVVNYITKRPSGSPRYSTGFSVGSENDFRWNGEATGPIGEKFGYSLSMFAQQSGSWVDHAESERFGIAPVIEWKPFENTTITLDLEYMRRETSQTEGLFSSSDSVLFKAFGEDLDGDGNPDQLPYMDVDASANNGIEGNDRLGFLRYPGAPGDGSFRWGSDGESIREDYGVMINILQKVGERLSFQGGYYYSAKAEEGLRSSFGTTTVSSILKGGDSALFKSELPANDPLHPDYDTSVDPYGRVLTYKWTQGEEKQVRHQFRVEGAYDLPITDWWSNNFVFGASHNIIELYEISYQLKDVDNGPDSTFGERYEDAPSNWQFISDPSKFRFNPRPGEFFATEATGDLGTQYYENGAYFIHQGKFFENRIRSVTGLRYDLAGVRRVDVDQTTGERSLQPSDEAPSSTNLSVGVSAQLNEDSPWAIYYLTAGAVKPEFGRFDASGTLIPPTQGQSQEVGFKFDIENKDTGRPMISGTVAFYEVIREGVIESGDVQTPTAEDAIFDEDLEYGNNVLRDDVSRGMDFQMIFTDLPIKNLQTIVNFSYNDYEITSLSGVSYELDSEFEGGPDGFDPATERRFIEKDLLDGLNLDRRNNGTPEFTAKLWTKYEFKEGFLDGFNIGGGVRWVDEREAVQQKGGGPLESSFLVMEPQTLFDLAFGYKNSFRDFDYNIRLNISNLTDEGGLYGYSYVSPRSFRLSASVSF
jgi:outer membrane receptor protein involved in Fe transport